MSSREGIGSQPVDSQVRTTSLVLETFLMTMNEQIRRTMYETGQGFDFDLVEVKVDDDLTPRLYDKVSGQERSCSDVASQLCNLPDFSPAVLIDKWHGYENEFR